jgi:hypothetical protein
MNVVEEQAKELSVDAAGGAKDGGQERDTVIVSLGMLILLDFLFGCFTQRLVDVGRKSKLGLKRERRLLLSWAKAGKDSKGRSKATRSEGDDLEKSAARALMRQGGRGRGGRG